MLPHCIFFFEDFILTIMNARPKDNKDLIHGGKKPIAFQITQNQGERKAKRDSDFLSEETDPVEVSNLKWHNLIIAEM